MVGIESGQSNHFEHDIDLSESSEIDQIFTPEICDDLFETLAHWNEVLEKDFPEIGGLDL